MSEDIKTKKCNRCGLILPVSDFDIYHTGPKAGLVKYLCRPCMSARRKELYKPEKRISSRSNHRLGICRPMEEAKDSGQYLGIYVAERVLSKFFDNISRMPINNPGYDYVCGRGFKIDVKSACVRKPKNRNPRWEFRIGKNKTADYFLCLAFDNREDLNPVHVWLIPGDIVNTKSHISVYITEYDNSKWKKYERPIDRVIACCSELRGETA